MQLRPALARDAPDIVAGRQGFGAELARGREKIAELHRTIAGDARHRRFAARIGVGELLHHLVAEAGLVVENIVGNAEAPGDGARVLDVLAGTAGPGLARRDTVIV